MTLQEYMSEHVVSQTQIARRFGTSPGMICKILSRAARPSLKLAIRLELELGVECVTWA